MADKDEQNTGDATGAGDGETAEKVEKVEFTAEQQTALDVIIGERLTRARTKWDAEQAAAQEKAQDAAEEARLAKDAEWQALAERHETRVSELEPLEGQMKAYQTAVETMLKARLEALGKTAKVAVENLPGDLGVLAQLTWLNANEGLFTRPAVADLDAQQGGQGTAVEATEDEVKEFAARMGIDPQFVDPKQLIKVV